MNKFFKHDEPIKFNYPSKIDFHNKVFHLFGRFKNKKEGFAKELEILGAECRGKEYEKVKPKETDYFVLADAGLGKHKPNGGGNVQEVQKYNDDHKKIMIPILEESYCKKLIDNYNKEHLSTPKP